VLQRSVKPYNDGLGTIRRTIYIGRTIPKGEMAMGYL